MLYHYFRPILWMSTRYSKIWVYLFMNRVKLLVCVHGYLVLVITNFHSYISVLSKQCLCLYICHFCTNRQHRSQCGINFVEYCQRSRTASQSSQLQGFYQFFLLKFTGKFFYYLLSCFLLAFWSEACLLFFKKWCRYPFWFWDFLLFAELISLFFRFWQISTGKDSREKVLSDNYCSCDHRHRCHNHWSLCKSLIDDDNELHAVSVCGLGK